MRWLTPARILWALTVVVLAATIALGATRGRDWWEARQVEQAQDAALAAGKQLAVNFATIDYRKVDEDTSRVKDGATGEFLSSYTSQLEELKKVIVDNKSVSKVERAEAGLVTGDRDSATVIVGIVAPTTNTVVPKGETKTYRTKLGLRLVGDEWKVERLEFVG
ncbi:Mce-associated membrane protein [Knoellia remsis]|uniref:Mce-associated membrane protein n=1 Tax=Knoellia remsis TaxID=407159 RepID=A0A2T0UI17_9MICO|nr:hypothetical protein [Knoellia remsis]PRY57506.1 Mce-associated membrane protein [Knoellia remsis]